MIVRVYSGSVLVEEVKNLLVERAQQIADYWQDEGYKVRVEAQENDNQLETA